MRRGTWRQGQHCDTPFICGRRLLLAGSLKQRVQAVADYAVDYEGAAGIGNLAKEKFRSAVAIYVDGINQLKLWNYIQVPRIGYIRQRFVQLAIHIFANH
jgi:hypothetical protein